MASQAHPSWLRLAHRVAIVTGAGSGIGQSVSYHLTQQGCHVVLADKSLAAVQESAHQCLIPFSTTSASVMAPNHTRPHHHLSTPATTLDVPPSVLPIQCDVACSTSVQQLIQASDDFAQSLRTDKTTSTPFEDEDSKNEDADDPFLKSERIPLASILVNCAGITKDAMLTKMTDADFDEVVNINLRGSYLTCRYFAQLARLEQLNAWTSTRCSSSIINVSSIVGLRGNQGQTNYAASKAGVIGMTKSMAKELARYNVRANAIVPGFIDTPMSAKMPEQIRATMKSNIPMKKFGTTDNVADLILFLASERAAYITGEAVEISGAISF